MAENEGNPTATGEVAQPTVDPQLAKVLDEFDQESATPPTEAKGDDSTPDFSALANLDLDKIPLDKLPANIRDRMLMHKDYTQKTQALAEERRKLQEESLTKENAILTSTIQRLQAQGVEATPDLVEQIKQKIAEGDTSAVADLVQAEIQRGLDPVKNHLALTEAIGYAERSIPHFKEYSKEVEEVLRSRPDLQAAARASGYAMAPRILEGITYFVHAQKIEAAYKALEASIPTKIKEALRAHQDRLKKSPSTTSRAGGIQATPGKGGEPIDARESMERAWKEHVGG
jgi:anti-sigma28 factor (negative regulator of flagellin synthesis)